MFQRPVPKPISPHCPRLQYPIPHLVAVLIAVTILLPRPVAAQTDNPSGPQTDIASYAIEARFDPASKQIVGSARLVYRNPGSDPLDQLWFHLYLNAFRGPDTLWRREDGGVHHTHLLGPDQAGWIRVESLTLADGTPLRLEPADADETIARTMLPAPLLPDQSVTIELRWTAQLPQLIARTGTAGDFVLAGQWYPKLAVYDRGRWDREPWHANAEFFADFGNYDLALTVPASYITGASGSRQTETFNDDGTRTVRYRAERVTDIAWTAWPGYAVVSRAVEAAGQRVELELLLPPIELPDAERFLSAATEALDTFGRWYGPYPWPRLTVVVPPAGADAAGGMEYPTFVTSDRNPVLPFGLGTGIHLIEVVTVHEIAHQWFPLQVQSNEAAEPWLDEAFADYLTVRLLDRRFGRDRSLFDLPFGRLGYAQTLRAVFLLGDVRQPINQPAWRFTLRQYGSTIYAKGSLTLLTAEQQIGEPRFTAALRAYADNWRWRHPTTADLRAELTATAGQQLDPIFEGLVEGRSVVEYALGADPRQPMVERRGEVHLPVEIRLDLGEGSRRVERWDASGASHRLGAAGERIVNALIDPAERLPVQLSRVDDGRSSRPDAAAASIAVVFQTIAQALLLIFGAIG
jgi:hypothetical protein